MGFDFVCNDSVPNNADDKDHKAREASNNLAALPFPTTSYQIACGGRHERRPDKKQITTSEQGVSDMRPTYNVGLGFRGKDIDKRKGKWQ